VLDSQSHCGEEERTWLRHVNSHTLHDATRKTHCKLKYEQIGVLKSMQSLWQVVGLCIHYCNDGFSSLKVVIYVVLIVSY
jgi:hypothetical protein